MNSHRLPLAIILLVWIIAEAWVAWYWWPSRHFSQEFPSVGIPITAIALVMMGWTLLRSFAIKLSHQSGLGKFWGIVLLFVASVMGGFAPFSLGRILADNNMFRASFHGEAGWPAAVCSISLWLMGAMYFVACLVEILLKTNSTQRLSHQ